MQFDPHIKHTFLHWKCIAEFHMNVQLNQFSHPKDEDSMLLPKYQNI